MKKETIEKILKYTLATVMVPIFIGVGTAYITFKMDKPKEYLIRESFDLEKLDVKKYFPLQVGNYWIYSRDMSFESEKGKKNYKDEVKVEVINYYKNGDNELLVMQGDPLLEEEAKKANEIIYGYIVVSNKVINVPSWKINSLIEKFKNKGEISLDDTDRLYIEYEFPLYNGQKYGEFSQLFRKDAKNISNVTKLTPYRKKVGENILDVGVYQIDNLYNSGDEQKLFNPYLGVTEYSYEHRGTEDKYLIDLKEYKIKED